MEPVIQAAADQLQQDWNSNPRWNNITRDFTAEEVVRLRGRAQHEHTLAKRGAEKLSAQLTNEHAKGEFTHALGAMAGGQAVPQIKARLPGISLSGWQVAAH